MHIDITNTTLNKPFLYLCKPNRDILYNLYESYEVNHKISLGQINELSFSLPYEIEDNHALISAPYIDFIKHRYLIKYVYGTYEEWFVLNVPTDNAEDDSDVKSVECLSLGIELQDKIIRNYEELSLTATEFFVDILDGTIWNVGYIAPAFDLMHRAFEVTSSTVLDMVFQGATTFGGLIKWDTINRTVSLYEYDQIGLNQDLIFDYGQYLQTLENTIDPDDFCTRLYVVGKDGQIISGVNPTGMPYIENFTYFIYPFTRDVNKVPLTHSIYMTDSLCGALLDYQDLIASKQDSFTTLLGQLTVLQSALLILESDLVDLEGELVIIQDALDIAQSTGGATAQLLLDKSAKELEITNKEAEIAIKETGITDVNALITILNTEISMEVNFTSAQIIELNQFIIEKEVSNEYISNAEQLLIWGKKQLLKLVEPKININIDVVNFLQCLDPECVADSVKLSLSGGDVVRVRYDKFGVDIEATITEIDLDYDSEDIKLTISNVKDIRKDKDKFLEMMNKSISTSLEIDYSKYKWNGIESTANEVKILMDGLWDSYNQTLKASLNEYVEIGRQGIILTDSTDPLRLVRLTHGLISCSKDGGDTFDTALTADGVIAEKIYGQLIIGQNLLIDASSDLLGESFFKVDETGVWIKGSALHIDGSELDVSDPNAVHFGEQYNSMILSPTGGISITNATNLKSRIVLNAADELDRTIRIQKSSDGKSIDDEFKVWNDVFYTDAVGNLNMIGTLTGSTIRGSTVEAGLLDTDSIIKMTDDGLWAGDAIMLNAPFSVDIYGHVKATGADIEGIITCTQLWIGEEDVSTKIATLEGKFLDPFYQALDFSKLFAQGTGQIIEYVELPWTEETPLNGNLDFMFTNWYTDHPCYILQPSVAAQVLYDSTNTYYIGVRVPNFVSTGTGIFNLIAVCDGFYKKATDPDPIL